MDALRSLGGEDWFALGDGDMALHVLRTLAMARGQTLTDITRAFAAAWNIDATILPMTDQSVATCLSTDEGELEFQRSEEHTSELQSLMRISYAVFSLKKKNKENPK